MSKSRVIEDPISDLDLAGLLEDAEADEEAKAAAEAAKTALTDHGASEKVAAKVSEAVRTGLAEKARNLPPDLVFDVALGVEDEYDVAERFGFSKEEYDVIAGLKSFQVQVKKVRADLDKQGDMFRAKAHIMAEKVMDNAFAKAISSTTPLKETTEFLKVVSGLADLMPKVNAAASGPGFSVSIVLPDFTAEAQRVAEKVKKDALSTISGTGTVVDDVVSIDIPEVQNAQRENPADCGDNPESDEDPESGDGGDSAGDGGGSTGNVDGGAGGESGVSADLGPDGLEGAQKGAES